MTAFLIILMIAIICIISYERPIKMTAQNMNYYTIRATLDVFKQIEDEHQTPIASLLYDDKITQREIELAADELMIDRGIFTRNPFRLDQGQFNMLVWLYFSQLQNLSKSEQTQIIYQIAD
jgi:hypothetical protein